MKRVYFETGSYTPGNLNGKCGYPIEKAAQTTGMARMAGAWNPFIFFLIFPLLLISFSGYAVPHAIQFENENYDFGTVEEETEVNVTYVFKNTGTEVLIIENVQPSCGCTTTSGWDRTVAPGAKGKIPVSFIAPRYNGPVTKLINVKTNIPDRPSIQLSLTGKIIIPVEIVPLNTWLGEITGETASLTGSYLITNNTESPLKIIEVIPPDKNTEYTLTVIEENHKYKLEYTINAPFEGEETVGKRFTLKTNQEKHAKIYPQFFYFVQPAIQVFPKQLLINPGQLLSNPVTLEINIKSNIKAPVKILDLTLKGGKGINYSLKELTKDKYYQIKVTIPTGYTFSEKEKVLFSFRIQNDPKQALYSIPVQATPKTP